MIRLGGGGSEEDFCGFSLRFQDGTAALSPTSRSLNPGYGGKLEDCIKHELIIYLGPKLDRLGFRLGGVEARTNPDAAFQARAARAGIQGAVPLPRGLLAGIKR